MNENKFNIKLKELREENGLSQTALAKLLHVSQPAIAKWESGSREPEYEILIRIAQLFKVSTDYLLGLED